MDSVTPQISLAPYASHWQNSRGRQMAQPQDETAGRADGRTPYQRDRDRIIHSTAFRRLKHKSQVFIEHEGDYYRTRLTHSLEVAQVARGLARALGLDEDLAEAIALAHDFGHPPFGHAGESELARLMEGYGGFDHNEQSLRVLTRLEHAYIGFDGLNLTWEVLEGIAKHNGPVSKPMGAIAVLDKEMSLRLDTFASMEAQVAAIADDIAYLSHDCDDGIRAGMIKPAEMMDVPLVGGIFGEIGVVRAGREASAPRAQDIFKHETSRLVHELTRRLIKGMVGDVIDETRRRLAESGPVDADGVRAAGRGMVAFSVGMAADVAGLREFLSREMWNHYKVNRMNSKGRRIIRGLFKQFMNEPETLPDEWSRPIEAMGEAEKARHIVDYVASMTDRYAITEHERLFGMGALIQNP